MGTPVFFETILPTVSFPLPGGPINIILGIEKHFSLKILKRIYALAILRVCFYFKNISVKVERVKVKENGFFESFKQPTV